ncbi:MAG: hypothetical protein M3P92_13225 [Actinomycetota bacterium]|nr:hypothetical protein [Actinomycetota bacterium]
MRLRRAKRSGPFVLPLSVVGLAAVVVLLPFLEVTDTLVQSILAYVLVLPVGALLYGLLALAADLMVLSLLFLGSTPGP